MISVKVTLFAYLRDGRFHEAGVDMPQGATVSDLLTRLGIDQVEVGVLMVNGHAGSFNTQLATGDRLTIIPPIGGG